LEKEVGKGSWKKEVGKRKLEKEVEKRYDGNPGPGFLTSIL